MSITQAFRECFAEYFMPKQALDKHLYAIITSNITILELCATNEKILMLKTADTEQRLITHGTPASGSVAMTRRMCDLLAGWNPLNRPAISFQLPT